MSKDGGSAFPRMRKEWNCDHEEREYVTTGGMTLRDYFAAKALPGLLPDSDLPYVADQAYEIADLMLAAREKS